MGVNAADRRLMRKALGFASKSVGLASPNPPVGCVIAREGRIVGRGWHEFESRDHAEVRALREAGELARGATAYLTLEPCSHHGRTPPCAPALIEAGLGRVVIACTDPNPRVAGEGMRLLRSAGIEVEVGLLGGEAARLIEPFACHVTTGLPLVVSKAGMSLDGRISVSRRAAAPISCREGIAFGQDLRLRLDALLVGVGTLLADDPQLTYRGALPKSRPLVPVVLDSRLRTPADARLFYGPPPARPLIFCGPDAPSGRRKKIEKSGAEVVPVPRTDAGLDLAAVLAELGGRNVLGLLVEGGSAVHWSFLEEERVDKFFFIIAPVVIGGVRSVPSVGGAGYARIDDAPRFRIVRSFSAGLDQVLETYPSYSRSILSPWREREDLP